MLRNVSVDALFTDIDLGGRDGFELAQTALSLQPLLAVVFISGRPRLRHGMCQSVGVPFLAKPYRLAVLVETIEQALKANTTQQEAILTGDCSPRRPLRQGREAFHQRIAGICIGGD